MRHRARARSRGLGGARIEWLCAVLPVAKVGAGAGTAGLALTTTGCAYQLACAAIRAREFLEFDNGLRHTALRDIITSNDPASPDAIQKLCAAGMPRQNHPGEEPYAVLAARRHEHPAYFKMLVILAAYGYDFSAISNTPPHETAKDILEMRAPEMFERVQHDAWLLGHPL
jgi:hypothetical protein